jgi:hypothetical protein
VGEVDVRVEGAARYDSAGSNSQDIVQPHNAEMMIWILLLEAVVSDRGDDMHFLRRLARYNLLHNILCHEVWAVAKSREGRAADRRPQAKHRDINR